MHIWTDLIAREAVFLVTLLALGSGPAAFLSERVDAMARLALAPVFGLCLGVVVTTTILQYEPVHSTYWVLIPAAIVSVGIAVWRIGRAKPRASLPLRELLQIAVVAIAVLGPASYTLHQRSSVGPVTFNVYDAAGYVSETDSEQTRSIRAASAAMPPYSNLAQEFWTGYARGFQNTDATALEGSVTDILGLGSTDTQAPFMIVIMFAGALGLFAGFRYVTRSRGWGAALAGALYGGPFFLQLWADSSQAALCGLALIVPFVILGAEALREPRLRNLVLLALVSSGLLTVYPLFVPQAVGGSLIVLLVLLARELRRRRPDWRPRWREAVAVAWRLGLVIGLAALFSPIAFGRDLRYWQAILDGQQSFVGLPVYHMGIGKLPSWILQTREFYDLVGVSTATRPLLSGLIPAFMVALIIVGLRWQRRAVVLLAFGAVCAVLAQYVSAKSGCEYCAQRNLLPVGPPAALLLAIGVAAVAAMPRALAWAAAAVCALVVVGFVAQRMRVERERIADTAYFLDSSDRAVLAHLPGGDPSVEVEGFGENPRGPGELPLVYDLVNERTHDHASIAIDIPDYSSFAYLGGVKPPGAEFNPGYRYVLTRFDGVQTDRRVIARSDGIALEERTQQLDVTPVHDLGVPLARLDPEGATWIQGGLLGEPLLLYVTGGTSPGPVWVKLRIASEEAVGVIAQRGVSSRQRGRILSVCIRASGTAPLRTASLSLSFTPIAGPVPPEAFYLPPPAEGVELIGMSASATRCIP